MNGDPAFAPQLCEGCGAEVENDIDEEGRGVQSCPTCSASMPAVGDPVRTESGRLYGRVNRVATDGNPRALTVKFSWGHVVHSDDLRWQPIPGTWVIDDDLIGTR
jgi:hypothetical protein